MSERMYEFRISFQNSSLDGTCSESQIERFKDCFKHGHQATFEYGGRIYCVDMSKAETMEFIKARS